MTRKSKLNMSKDISLGDLLKKIQLLLKKLEPEPSTPQTNPSRILYDSLNNDLTIYNNSKKTSADLNQFHMKWTTTINNAYKNKALTSKMDIKKL